VQSLLAAGYFLKAPLTYEQLYDTMMAEMNAVHSQYPDPLTRIEKGFLVAWRYRNQLPLKTGPDFPVVYFKTWLPLFESEIKYHELCYYAENFAPDGALHDRQNFLLRELGRRERTISETQGLFDYVERGATDRDEELFGSDPETAAEYAKTIAGFLALDRYDRFLEARFRNLFKQQPHDPSSEY